MKREGRRAHTIDPLAEDVDRVGQPPAVPAVAPQRPVLLAELDELAQDPAGDAGHFGEKEGREVAELGKVEDGVLVGLVEGRLGFGQRAEPMGERGRGQD
jgi:hypothetical protein